MTAGSPAASARVNGGLLLQKTNGSQRFGGLSLSRNRAPGFISARPSARGEPWHDYSGASPALGAQVTPDDQIGLLAGIGDNHLRLEIPACAGILRCCQRETSGMFDAHVRT